MFYNKAQVGIGLQAINCLVYAKELLTSSNKLLEIFSGNLLLRL